MCHHTSKNPEGFSNLRKCFVVVVENFKSNFEVVRKRKIYKCRVHSPHMTNKNKLKFEISGASVVNIVTFRLKQWKNYHEHNSNSTPSPAYGVADKVADAIFQARKPRLQNNTSDPVIDLRVSPEAIMQSYERAKKGHKYIF